MERLTQHTPNGASLILDNPGNAEEARQQVTAKFMLACNRLAAYEDTNLTPEDINRLKILAGEAISEKRQWQKQLSELRQENEQLRGKVFGEEA